MTRPGAAICILIGISGVIGMIVVIIGVATYGEISSKALGNAIGASIFLIPGIWLYRYKPKVKLHKCSDCNVYYQYNYKYCGSCGAKLKRDSK